MAAARTWLPISNTPSQVGSSDKEVLIASILHHRFLFTITNRKTKKHFEDSFPCRSCPVAVSFHPMSSSICTPEPGFVWMRDARSGRWLAFGPPRRILTAHAYHEIPPLLARLESIIQREGVWAAGFISYEAAPAFDSAMRVHVPASLPLVWFGLYDPPILHEILPWPEPQAFRLSELQPGLDAAGYTAVIARIQAAIARGDTYQVNFTFPLQATCQGDPWQGFLALQHNQRGRFGAFIQGDDWAIASASPELFFYREGGRVWMRPMKGTAPRGASPKEDTRLARELAASEKNRAENVMIVDMIRNDLGRIARVGSVQTTDLFRIEPYPTLFQMTSTVQARTDASFPDLLAALFPSASITGAPKIRTMQIIHALEPDPRGVYTGAIGFLAPDGRAQFNVAIRTAVIHPRDGMLTYHVGSGVVWDSEPSQEYAECLLKARVLTQPLPDFQLLESLRWTPDHGYILLERHLDRLCASARYFHYPCPLPAIRHQLDALAASLPRREHKVRLRVDAAGQVAIEAAPLQNLPSPQRLKLASFPVEPDDPFLRHKTTHRPVYAAALREHPDADDVILWNRRGELTETTRANLILALDGKMVTPAASSGLLPGTFRAELLAHGNVQEAVLPVEALTQADAVYLINSVRGIVPAEIPSHGES